ncbi:transmembrane protease serine 11C [Trichonephila clavata]|uniref:Transmembrane protease serine 11C n=1 Tax=Trichonephila clavata TaxID=2740835 RepID=A0A8X6M4P1_TRICU|nr:transmembrane protease serine 11C [Trichonephila clavata]
MLDRTFSSILIILLVMIKDGHTAEVVDKIVGGRIAEENEFPFQASLQKRSMFGYFHTCGAVLIADEWLLTAAHCIKLNSTSSYKIMIGSNTLKPAVEENYYSIKTIILKQGFDDRYLSNDIALIRLSIPVRNSGRAIKLSESAPDLNCSATVIGWGATEDGGSASNELQKADVDVISREDCLDIYGRLAESMMCAGKLEGGTDACQGDSGGSLVQFQNGEPVLIGIVSWGISCAEPKLPGVYTDVTLFNTWIKHYVLFEN